MSELRDPVEADVRAWRVKLQREQLSRADRNDSQTTDPTGDLQQIAQTLEADLAGVLEKSARVARRCADFEMRAVEAVREGDDVTARRTLLAPQACAETLARLDADAQVVRAMLAECREAVSDARAHGVHSVPPHA